MRDLELRFSAGEATEPGIITAPAGADGQQVDDGVRIDTARDRRRPAFLAFPRS